MVCVELTDQQQHHYSNRLFHLSLRGGGNSIRCTGGVETGVQAV